MRPEAAKRRLVAVAVRARRYRESVRNKGMTMGDTAHPGPYLLPPHTSTCTGCGPANSHGLQLVVYRDGDEVYSDVTFDERHIGAPPGLAHGGAVATACDDVLGFTLWVAGTPAVTRSLTVEYLRPVPLHEPHRITAQITGRQGRALHVSGTGVSHDGITRFTASAVFVTVGVDHFAAHGDVSGFEDLFDRLAGALHQPIGDHSV